MWIEQAPQSRVELGFGHVQRPSLRRGLTRPAFLEAMALHERLIHLPQELLRDLLRRNIGRARLRERFLRVLRASGDGLDRGHVFACRPASADFCKQRGIGRVLERLGLRGQADDERFHRILPAASLPLRSMVFMTGQDFVRNSRRVLVLVVDARRLASLLGHSASPARSPRRARRIALKSKRMRVLHGAAIGADRARLQALRDGLVAADS